jgi:hypothetical protein
MDVTRVYIIISYIPIITLFVRKDFKTPKTNVVPLSQAKLFTMKYHKFNRRGRYDLFALRTYYKSRKKQDYMVNTGRSKCQIQAFYGN